MRFLPYREVSFVCLCQRNLRALLHSDTFRQLFIIVEVLLPQTVIQAGEQVIVTHNNIRAVRRMVEQLPVEMLQQGSNVSICVQTFIAMEKNNAGCQHFTPFVLTDPTEFF
jgi:hypothetical protein